MSGSDSVDRERIALILQDDPVDIALDNNPVIVVQKDNKETIFAWSPHIMILGGETTVILADQKEEFPSHAFVSKVPQLLEKICSQIIVKESSFDVFSYIGFYGLISFELARYLEEYNHRLDHPSYPELIFMFPTRYLIDTPEYRYYIQLSLPSIVPGQYEEEFPWSKLDASRPIKHIIHRVSLEKYLSAVASIREQIRNGEIYQANYTQQFQVTTDIEPKQLFLQASKQSLGHSAYFRLHQFHVISFSPELFLRVKEGCVLTKPIKGTRPRGKTSEMDELFKQELLHSEKDLAELSMIVDLCRNDLGKSSLPGSVVVSRHAVLESYENVHHLVSYVESKISPDIFSSWNLFLRALPGASISGVPKLRSLEIIEENEPLCRGIYTGNIGYFSGNGNLEFNIAIRTIILHGRLATFNSGGGIVFDSDPFSEYMESIHKAKHLANYLGVSFTGHIVWINGKFEHAEAPIPNLASNGCFETILVKDGVAQHLQDHLQRIKNAMAILGLDGIIPSLDDVSRFLELNIADTARLNIYAFLSGQIPYTIMKIQPYSIETTPVVLMLDDQAITVPPAIRKGIKSLDYELYRLKTQKAIARGCWDMLLHDGKYVLEGGRCTVFFFDTEWMTPRTNVVSGTVRQRLLNRGKVKLANILVEDLMDPEKIKAMAIGNALNGIRPVSAVYYKGKIIWESNSGTIAELNV